MLIVIAILLVVIAAACMVIASFCVMILRRLDGVNLRMMYLDIRSLWRKRKQERKQFLGV